MTPRRCLPQWTGPLTRHLGQLLREKDLSAHRYQKFRAMGAVLEETET